MSQYASFLEMFKEQPTRKFVWNRTFERAFSHNLRRTDFDLIVAFTQMVKSYLADHLNFLDNALFFIFYNQHVDA